MGKRGVQKWSRDELPVGTIRVRKNGKKTRVRMIKIRKDGPKGMRWINYARYLWEMHRGKVPAGMRVAHEDGNTLNDALANLVLATPGDVAAICHDADPDMSRQNYLAVAAATAECNRLRAVIRRQLGWVPTYWYPVDHGNRLIVNKPVRHRHEAFGVAPSKNGAGYEAAALGWPGINRLAAYVLDVLSDGEDKTQAGIRQAIKTLHCVEMLDQTFASIVSSLRKRGWLLTTGPRRVAKQKHRITVAALHERGPVSPFVPVRGIELETDKYLNFERLDHDGAGFASDPGTTRAHIAGRAALLAHARNDPGARGSSQARCRASTANQRERTVEGGRGTTASAATIAFAQAQERQEVQ